MIKILLVEDEQHKCEVIVRELLLNTKINLNNIDVVSNVLDAKKSIKKSKYELLILDINIPLRAGTVVVDGSGLDVIQYIKVNQQAIKPSHIIGLSGYDQGIELAQVEFSSPLWKLVKYSHSDLSWSISIRAAIDYLISASKPPYACDGTTFHFDLAIFVALEKEELDSILALPGDWIRLHVDHDSIEYHVGKFKNALKDISVVVAASPRMGMPPAAVITAKIIHTFRPKYLAITGICAGVREKVGMGDILIADPSFDWGSGKWKTDSEGKSNFMPASYQCALDVALRASLKEFSENTDLFNSLHEAYDGEKPENLPVVHIDAMASGAAVLQSGAHMEQIRAIHKNLIGIDMETYSVFVAADYSSKPRPICFSIKSVCDFGDNEKGDSFHNYSAYLSARFLYHFSLYGLAKFEENIDHL